jgi:hypothetical protein
MAKTNGRKLSNIEITKIKEILLNVATNSKCDSNLNPLHMFRGELLPKTLIMVVCWIMLNFGFYALALNATMVWTF